MGYKKNSIKCGGLHIIPSDIDQFYYVRKIDLSWLYPLINNICNIPLELFNIVKLKKLNLGNNKIQILPKEISKLSELQYLNITNNKLSYLPKSLFFLNKTCIIAIDGNLFPDTFYCGRIFSDRLSYLYDNGFIT